jgi:hypothetical protein
VARVGAEQLAAAGKKQEWGKLVLRLARDLVLVGDEDAGMREGEGCIAVLLWTSSDVLTFLRAPLRVEA